MPRSSAHAARNALPPSWIDRLPEVTPSSGLYAVLAGSIFIFDNSTPSSSAAICANAVVMPCPSSTLPGAIVTVPPGSRRTRSGCLSGPLIRRSHDRLHDTVVRAAAAEILVERFAHLAFRGGLVFLEKGNGGD